MTSQDRWNEYADVILANPPFMSPKGGIKPHNRFSVQSKRSEVLFVDYMAEHLAPSGRAGIIVPEGVIFQSQAAYTQLRKMLVEEYLVAVVSLPAGVFNPYSGVKTSILILDKALAKQTARIAFLKIEKDGYGLGAQRRRLCTDMEDKPEQCPQHSDLPQARAEIAEFLRRLHARESFEDFQPTLGLVVSKEKIAANGDYNLSGERYRENGAPAGSFPWGKIESLVRAVTPPAKIQKTAYAQSGRFPIIDQSQEPIAGWTDEESAVVRPLKPLVVFGDHTCAVKLADKPFAQGADGIKILETLDILEPRYLFHVIRLRPLETVGYQRHFSLLKEMEIPLPPLGVQREIVAEIEGYQKVIDGAHAVLDNYRPHIPIHPDWPIVNLGDVASFRTGTTPDTRREEYYLGDVPFIKTSEIANTIINSAGTRISPSAVDDYNLRIFPKGTILMAMYGQGKTRGQVAYLNIPACTTQNAAAITPGDRVDSRYLYLFLLGQYDALREHGINGHISHLNLEYLRRFKIPVPPLDTQRTIAAEIEAEQALVNANRELIARMEKKIQATLARVWGEEIYASEKEEA